MSTKINYTGVYLVIIIMLQCISKIGYMKTWVFHNLNMWMVLLKLIFKRRPSDNFHLTICSRSTNNLERWSTSRFLEIFKKCFLCTIYTVMSLYKFKYPTTQYCVTRHDISVNKKMSSSFLRSEINIRLPTRFGFCDTIYIYTAS